jgi:hypothetical protein
MATRSTTFVCGSEGGRRLADWKVRIRRTPTRFTVIGENIQLAPPDNLLYHGRQRPRTCGGGAATVQRSWTRDKMGRAGTPVLARQLRGLIALGEEDASVSQTSSARRCGWPRTGCRRGILRGRPQGADRARHTTTARPSSESRNSLGGAARDGGIASLSRSDEANGTGCQNSAMLMMPLFLSELGSSALERERERNRCVRSDRPGMRHVRAARLPRMDNDQNSFSRLGDDCVASLNASRAASVGRLERGRRRRQCPTRLE